MMMRRRVLAVALAALFGAAALSGARAASAAEREVAADAMLRQLMASEPATYGMIEGAANVFVFPEIVMDMFIFGPAGGTGVPRAGGGPGGCYSSVAVSDGLQAGIARFGRALFPIDRDCLAFVRVAAGWEAGVDPNVTVAAHVVAKRLSASTVHDGIHVFFVDQKDLFARGGV